MTWHRLHLFAWRASMLNFIILCIQIVLDAQLVVQALRVVASCLLQLFGACDKASYVTMAVLWWCHALFTHVLSSFYEIFLLWIFLTCSLHHKAFKAQFALFPLKRISAHVSPLFLFAVMAFWWLQLFCFVRPECYPDHSHETISHKTN